MQITITVTGDKRIERKLRKIGSNIHNLDRAFKEISEQAIHYFQTRGFSSQGGVFGKKWAPLSAAYSRTKNGKYPGRSPLVATGEMQNSFAAETGKNYALIENRSDHFKYHQSDEARTIMPRRVTMGVNDEIRRIARTAIQREVRKKIRQA